MKLKHYFLCIVILVTYGCNTLDRIYLYSPDKSKCLTVFNSPEVRYIIEGKHAEIPDTNYIKLDVSDIPEVGDCMHIYWGDSIHKCEIVVAKSEIIMSKLDTTRFSFETALPLNHSGVPTEIKFRQEGAAIFSFYSMSLSPNKGAIVEFDD